MYIVKNAYLNIIRGKGRNILIGIIITAVTISACVALTINKSGNTLVQSYKDSNPIEVGFNLDPMAFREATDEQKSNFEALDADQIKKYGDSSYVTDYYYTLETTVSIDNITAVSYDDTSTDTTDEDNTNDKFGNHQFISMGDFRLTAYSDSSYITDFIEGTRKIIDGVMIDKENTDKSIVISEELATENNLKIGDKVNIYSPKDEETKYEFTIIGIYEDNNDIESNGFMDMNVMNSSNQIFTNITSINEIMDATDTSTDSGISNGRMRNNQGLTAKYYLKTANDVSAFEAEVRDKGLSTLYNITTNENSTLEKIKPIENLSNFSFSFLIVILVVGGLVLGIINMINIRERKYEIGVLRAIGMSKGKVALQLVAEIFIVAVISLIIGTGIGTILSQPVTNQMLRNEISSYEEKLANQQQNFGPGNFERPGFVTRNSMYNQNNTKTDYVSMLDVSVDAITIMQLFLVSLFLTIISGLISVMFVNKYEPNKILQNRA